MIWQRPGASVSGIFNVAETQKCLRKSPNARPAQLHADDTPQARFLPLLFTLNVVPVAAQLAIDFAASASGKTITAHTGYTANCAAQTASVPNLASKATLPDVSNQPACAITRRFAQVSSNSTDGGAAKVEQSAVTFWGGFYYDNDVDGDSFLLEFDGWERVAYLGFDAYPRDNLLAGLMVSRSKSEIDYTAFDNTGSWRESGDYDARITSVNPYINWSAPDGKLELWAMAGYGEGDSDLDLYPPSNAVQLITDPTRYISQVTFDLKGQAISVGGNKRLLKRGASKLRLEFDALQVKSEIKSSDVLILNSVTRGERLRVALEAEHAHIATGGVQLKPSAGVRVRFDESGEETGTSIEVGFKLLYTDPNLGLTVDFDGRTLIRHNRGDENYYENYYNEWDFSIGGSWRSMTGADGEGLSFSVSPGYSEIIAGGQPIWQTLLDAAEKEPRMSARVEYGLPAFGGLLTPYSEIPLGGPNKIYRLGARWALDSSLNLKLTGDRRDKGNAISLTGGMRF